MLRALLIVLAVGVASARATVVTLPANHDTSLDAGDPGNSNGGGPCFFAGTDGDAAAHRALISFNLSTIPAGSTITNVQLILTLAQVAGQGGGGGGMEAGSVTISLFDLTRSWGEGTVTSNNQGIAGTGHGAPANPGDATWSSAFFGQTLWSTPTGGGDHVSSASASLSLDVTTPGTVYTWLSTPQLVADVQGWLNNSSTNFGWELINSDETDTRTFYAFFSREWASYPGGLVTQEPALQVTYTPPVTAPVAAWASWSTVAGIIILCWRSLRRPAPIRA